MARFVYLDITPDKKYEVTVINGARDKRTTFDKHTEACRFAMKQCGRTGYVMDYTTMSPEQRLAQLARENRMAAILAGAEA